MSLSSTARDTPGRWRRGRSFAHRSAPLAARSLTSSTTAPGRRQRPYHHYADRFYRQLTNGPRPEASAPDAAGQETAAKSRAAPAATRATMTAPPLQAGLQRLYRQQRRERRRQPFPGLFRRRSRRARIVAALSIPGIVVLTALVALIPILYQGTRAYRKVFVPPAQHDTRPVLPMLNAAGTPVISTAVTSSSAAAWNGKDRVTILLIGVDRRTTEVARSDTMILLSIDPTTKTASMMSIPRDLKVVIPGHGVNKINAAYAFGDATGQPSAGPSLCIRTIEANFGLRINFFAEVNFQGFIQLVNLVGGITLDVPYPIKDDAYPAPNDQYTRVYFAAGWQHMDGARALEYARTRHDDGDGNRSLRQQQVLLALRQRAINLNLITKAPSLIETIGDSVHTDLSPTQALELARIGASIGAGGITQYSLDPALTEDAEPGQPYYLIADWDAVGQIISKFAGKAITPPAAALAHPNHAIPIHVENGTTVSGLAHRVAAVLTANGFTNVTIGNRSDAGDYPQTIIDDSSGSVATSAVVAGLVGVSVDAINEDYGTQPAGTTTSAATGTPGASSLGSITVILGDNAHDPANTVPDNDAASS